MINKYIFSTEYEQYVWVAKSVQDLLLKNVPAGEIAIIARAHNTLKQLLPALNNLGIKASYEHNENILEKPHIFQILQILRFVDSLNQAGAMEDELLLSEILQYPFWSISTHEIYKVSIGAYKNRKTWLQTITDGKFSDIENVINFLFELKKDTFTLTSEQIIDKIIGASVENLEPEENDFEKSLSGATSSFTSPYKSFYFDANFETDKTKYYELLSNLKTFISAIREYKKNQAIKISDILEYIDLMAQSNSRLIDNSKYNIQENAVNLCTAHGAKGLEFEHVFVLNCQESEWAKKPNSNKVGLPLNLRLFPERDNTDDFLRLFFVAITRAKHNLYLSSFTSSENGKEILELSFISELDSYVDNIYNFSDQVNSQSLEIWQTSNSLEQLKKDELAYLEPILETYKLSVTHLNNFLDLSQGGPRYFLEKNLLRFPQSKTVHSSYGTAMHAAINYFYNDFLATKQLPSLNTLTSHYQRALSFERMRSGDYQEFLEKGIFYLTKYFESQSANFNLTDELERDFSNQNVFVGEAQLTGKIDKIKVLEDLGSLKEVEVVDFKTGKSYSTWDAKAEEQNKLDRYHRQLIFYKILVENSRSFAGKYQVRSGSLEFLQFSEKTQNIEILTTEITQQEVADLEKIIQSVWKKIMTLDFTCADKYSPDMNGTKEFIEYLLNQ